MQLKKWHDVTNSLVTEGKTSGRTLIHTKKNNSLRREPPVTLASIWEQYEGCTLRTTLCAYHWRMNDYVVFHHIPKRLISYGKPFSLLKIDVC